MKKAWIFLIVVALLTLSVPLFADGPTVKFSMLGFWWANYDPSVSAAGSNAWIASGQQRVWPTADIVFDANNTLELALRTPRITGLDTPQIQAVYAALVPSYTPPTSTPNYILWGSSPNVGNQWDFANSIWHFMWTSDLSKAAGVGDLPVDVKLTIGIQDAVLTNWWYDNNGWEWEYGGPSKTPGTNWDSKLITINADSNFIGYHWMVGAGPITLHWVNDFSFQNTLLGAEASYMGAGVFVAYGIYNGAAAGNGDLAIEAKYDVPDMNGITLKPSIFFRDSVSANPASWVFGGDLTVGYQIFKLILGATSTSSNSLAHYSGTLFLNPNDVAQLWIAAYLDGATPDNAPLQGVDIGATYKFGAFKFIVGWFIAGADQTNNYVSYAGVPNTNTGMQFGQANSQGSPVGNNVTLGNDNVGAVRNGLYFGSAINF